MEPVELLDGVETLRSRSGTASMAMEGATLGDGELDRRRREVPILVGGLVVMAESEDSAMEESVVSSWLLSGDGGTRPAASSAESVGMAVAMATEGS